MQASTQGGACVRAELGMQQGVTSARDLARSGAWPDFVRGSRTPTWAMASSMQRTTSAAGGRYGGEANPDNLDRRSPADCASSSVPETADGNGMSALRQARRYSWTMLEAIWVQQRPRPSRRNSVNLRQGRRPNILTFGADHGSTLAGKCSNSLRFSAGHGRLSIRSGATELKVVTARHMKRANKRPQRAIRRADSRVRPRVISRWAMQALVGWRP